ncbi:MAG: peptidoglycan-binding domain-containing protein [Candidatus Competibacteraceae bacterium]
MAHRKSVEAAYPDKKIRFRGHREVANKACPVFNYKVMLGLDSSGYMTGNTSTTPAGGSGSKDFQKKHSLLPENGLDAKTREALIKALGTASSLKKPDKGNKIKVLQRLLKLAVNKNLTTDGDFGNKTQAAVEQFQTRKNLTANPGVADAKTQQALATKLLGSS